MAPARSPFDDWYGKACVHAGTRHLLCAADLDSGDCFSEALVPALAHPLVRARGDALRREVLIRAFYRYFAFTTQLEHRAVNRVASMVAHDELGIPMPAAMRLDAHRLYCDEAYHALFSADIIDQVSRLTGVAADEETGIRMLSELDRLVDAVPRDDRALARLMFACVSETLITRTLVDLPQDKQVVAPVRAIVLDHARDEARHHVYFASLFKLVWPSLDRGRVERLGPLLPRFIVLFLAPDEGPVRRALASHGMSALEADSVLDEVRASRDATAMKAAAAPTMKLFERTGVFAAGAVRDAFAGAGLLPDA